jgi:hypothetical protein
MRHQKLFSYLTDGVVDQRVEMLFHFVKSIFTQSFISNIDEFFLTFYRSPKLSLSVDALDRRIEPDQRRSNMDGKPGKISIIMYFFSGNRSYFNNRPSLFDLNLI